MITPVHHRGDAACDVSVIVPVLNEQENVGQVYAELTHVIDAQPARYEIVFVDDGSRDGTLAHLRQIVQHDPRVRVVQFTRRFGQTAALAAGFEHARGRVLVPMDGDGQNDPRDIPRLVARLDQGKGWDIVSGWRKSRHDKLVSRRLPSVIANRLIRKITWTREVHDFGCTLKAYRREVIDDVRLYGEMHRFLPAICKWRGARVTEEVVNHRPRTAGDSKYGINRTIKVLLDLITIKFLGDYLTKPIYFFGKVSMGSAGLAFAALTLAIVQKTGRLTEHGVPVSLNNNVLVLFAMMTFILAILFVMMGVLSELLVRIYHESHGLKPYKVRDIIEHRVHELSPADDDDRAAAPDPTVVPSTPG
ncbi:MAG: glycosyltransferase family 2 protein [Phycisphaeraceae bacterium]